METVELARFLENLLTSALEPVHLWIEDESAQHLGHPGARAGGRHVHVRIVSAHFTGKSLLERHRLVYQALAAHIGRQVHALRLQTTTPSEWGTEATDPCTCLRCAQDQR